MSACNSIYIMHALSDDFPLTKDKFCVQFTKPTKNQLSNWNYKPFSGSRNCVFESQNTKKAKASKGLLKYQISQGFKGLLKYQKSQGFKGLLPGLFCNIILVTFTLLLLLCCIFLSHQCRVQVWPGCKAILQQCSD